MKGLGRAIAPAAVGLGGYLASRAVTARIASIGPIAGLGVHAEPVAAALSFIALNLLTSKVRPVSRLLGRRREALMLGAGIAAAQSVLSAYLPDTIKQAVGLEGLGCAGLGDSMYDQLALRGYEEVPMGGMGGYEMTPMEGVQEHLAGDGIGVAERMLDAAEAQAGIGADAVEAAAGFGKYVLDGYETIPTAGMGDFGAAPPPPVRSGFRTASDWRVDARRAGQGRRVGLKPAGILSKVGAAVRGRRPPPPTVVHPATPGCIQAVVGGDGVARPIGYKGGPPLLPAFTVSPTDRARAIHVQSPADLDMLPGSSISSYAGVFSGQSVLGTNMEPY